LILSLTDNIFVLRTFSREGDPQQKVHEDCTNKEDNREDGCRNLTYLGRERKERQTNKRKIERKKLGTIQTTTTSEELQGGEPKAH
jgi:hypothetical protein